MPSCKGVSQGVRQLKYDDDHFRCAYYGQQTKAGNGVSIFAAINAPFNLGDHNREYDFHI